MTLNSKEKLLLRILSQLRGGWGVGRGKGRVQEKGAREEFRGLGMEGRRCVGMRRKEWERDRERDDV